MDDNIDTLLNPENSTDILPYLLVFQESFNLTADGELNDETLRLMKAPRCGNRDQISYSALSRWNKRQLTWRFVHPTHDSLQMGDKRSTSGRNILLYNLLIIHRTRTLLSV